MRKVNRTNPQPQSLAKNGDKWTKELLKAINESKKDGSKVPDKFYNKYKKPDVLKELKQIYGDDTYSYCCYCESIINDVGYEQIEHRMPRRKTLDQYPEKTFDWKNLHLACAKCNGHKGNEYDEVNPILDATIDDIEKHLSYKMNPVFGVYRETLSQQGITTVKHADLDREPLRTARRKIWFETMEAIDRIIELNNDPRVYTAKKELRHLCEYEHGSLIKHLMVKKKIWD